MAWLHWLPFVIWAAIIFFVSNQSHPPGADLGPDYVLHGIAYFILGVTAVWGATRGLAAELSARAAFLCWLAAVVYGATDEIHQSLVPLRNPSWSDLLADSLGSGLAVLISYLALRIWKRRRREGRA